MRLRPPDPSGRAWWRDHSLPAISLRRPDLPFFRELLRSLRSQVFVGASLIGLAFGAFGMGQSTDRGLILLISLAAVLPILVVETLRERRQRRERLREEVERAVTAELLTWGEGRMVRASQRLRDEFDWQVKTRIRDAWIDWHRQNVSGKLELLSERRRAAEEARKKHEEALRKHQAEHPRREIDALLVACRQAENAAGVGA